MSNTSKEGVFMGNADEIKVMLRDCLDRPFLVSYRDGDPDSDRLKDTYIEVSIPVLDVANISNLKDRVQGWIKDLGYKVLGVEENEFLVLKVSGLKRNTMRCKDCNKIINYNFHYNCYECSCGKTYNAVGQELRPLEEWQYEYDNEGY